jgi:hypothetical protein
MSVVVVELDDVSLEVQMGLEELLVEYVQPSTTNSICSKHGVAD